VRIELVAVDQNEYFGYYKKRIKDNFISVLSDRSNSLYYDTTAYPNLVKLNDINVFFNELFNETKKRCNQNDWDYFLKRDNDYSDVLRFAVLLKCKIENKSLCIQQLLKFKKYKPKNILKTKLSNSITKELLLSLYLNDLSKNTAIEHFIVPHKDITNITSKTPHLPWIIDGNNNFIALFSDLKEAFKFTRCIDSTQSISTNSLTNIWPAYHEKINIFKNHKRLKGITCSFAIDPISLPVFPNTAIDSRICIPKSGMKFKSDTTNLKTNRIWSGIESVLGLIAFYVVVLIIYGLIIQDIDNIIFNKNKNIIFYKLIPPIIFTALIFARGKKYLNQILAKNSYFESFVKIFHGTKHIEFD